MLRKLRVFCILLIIMMLIRHNGSMIEALGPNDDATLVQVKINGESLKDFNPFTQVYEIMLSSEEVVVPEVEAEANDQGAIVSIDPTKSLPGCTVITVTAEDGTVMTYIISFLVPARPEKSNDATLCEIRVNGQLLKGFDPLKQGYWMELPADEMAVPEITAIANESKATVEINQASGVITVTAEDGTTMIYTVDFIVAVRSNPIKKDAIKYDFDEIDVVYAAELMATPINLIESSWLTNIAGGLENSVKVTSGVVSMKKDGWESMEEFIKFSGANGSERFLMNSRSFEYYEGTSKVKMIKSQYWSAKKIEGSAVVKDFTGPIKAVIMWREFDEDQHMTAVRFICYDDYQNNDGFWNLKQPSKRYYDGNMSTLEYTGTPIIFFD